LSSNSGWKGDFSRFGRLLEEDLSVVISDLSDRSIDRYKAAPYISIILYILRWKGNHETREIYD